MSPQICIGPFLYNRNNLALQDAQDMAQGPSFHLTASSSATLHLQLHWWRSLYHGSRTMVDKQISSELIKTIEIKGTVISQCSFIQNQYSWNLQTIAFRIVYLQDKLSLQFNHDLIKVNREKPPKSKMLNGSVRGFKSHMPQS